MCLSNCTCNDGQLISAALCTGNSHQIGSGTKLFTWTAVMQLVEQGKLDLDADINTYLDFRIADPYPQPITSGI